MSFFSSSFVEQFNTKYEAFRLIHDPTRLITLLFSKYGDIQEDFYCLYINQLIYNLPTKFNCVYKEIKYTNLLHENLKRLYKKKECTNRIPKLSDYYKNYHLFFCRPTFRNYKLGKLMCNFEDKKAEIFYKNNYKESKQNISMEKEENNINKKNSSFSLSSFDNITNNKIIFDKQTKKILDRSQTESKNNNYYNTLILETSRSNLLKNNGLISKRNGGDISFEKCIEALIDYQYNKKKDKKNKKKVKNKNKNIKNIIISNSNINNLSKNKNILSQSQRSSYKFYNFKMYNNNSKILNSKINKINTSNNNSKNYINKIIKSKNKKKTLNSLSNNRYNTSTTTILNNQNIKKISNIKDFNINFPITTKNKDTKKNKMYNKIYIHSDNNTINNIRNNSKNNSNIVSKILHNSNYGISPNHIEKSTKLMQDNHNNFKKFSKLTEYLKQTKGIDNNFIQKNSLHKKNCLSIGDEDNKNLLFNINNNKKRITKKKITMNKNLKITITNGNTNTNINNTNIQKSIHIKNKTFDSNSINHINNNLSKYHNNIIINEEFNSLINKKPKKALCNLKIDNNNFHNNNNNINRNVYSKIVQTTNNKKVIFSPPSKKKFNKISVTQNSSKEKNNKKDLTVNILNPNNKKRENVYHKEIKSPHHKKNNKSVVSKNSINKDILIKSNKIIKSNFCLSPNNGMNSNDNYKENYSKNIGSHISPTNQHFCGIAYFSNSNFNNNKNNIYIKKSINKESKIINQKKENNTLINSCNIQNTTKELYPNNQLPNDGSNNINNIDNNKNILNNNAIDTNNNNLSRNKKNISKKNFNNSKKNNVYAKTNSSLNKNQLNNNNINEDNIKNNIINNSGNINISIKKSNINIKDSILHIDKIYIKKENTNKKPKNYEIEDVYQNKKTIEMKVRDEIIKTVGNNLKLNQVKMKSMDFSPFKTNYSPKVINVHRNNNLINKNNKEIKNKYK